MNRLRKLGLIATGSALTLVPLLMAAQEVAVRVAPQRITGSTLTPAADMKWVPMPGLQGALQVPLWGDSTKEAHRILYKWPAGTMAALHTHTHGDRGVVISGTLVLTLEGAQPKKLPAGSFFSFGANVKHATAVDGEVPCVFYIEREGPFDVVMVTEAGATTK